MAVMRALGAILVIALAGSAVSHGFERALDRRAIELAQALARSPIDADGQRFHAAYRIPVNAPPVDYVEIVTPYRRVVLAAEEAVRAGRTVGQRDARDALGDAPARVDVVVELTFHPLNTYVGVPSYEVTLQPATPGEALVEPLSLARVPRHGPRLGEPDVSAPLPVRPAAPRVPGGSEPMLGGTLVAEFDGGALDERGVYEVVITDGDDEIARARVDLSLIR